jgi:hypothetical protein
MVNTPQPEFVTFEQAKALLTAKLSQYMCAVWALDISWEAKTTVTRMITEKSPAELLLRLRWQKSASKKNRKI